MYNKMLKSKFSLIYALPVILAVIIIAILFNSLKIIDPSSVPSVYVGKDFPDITFNREENLMPLTPGFSTNDLKKGRLSIVNIWASWCTPCRAEHEVLMFLRNNGIVIFGINYKDKLLNASRFLSDLGNPYSYIGIDSDGISAINLGVYGIPETFVVDGNGVVLKKYVGPLTIANAKEIMELRK
ncbi:MAG: cytochrome c biogenesis protein CcmG/thiol:disulfide interchange protein DsbE [Alphaproteobacteria bacterium]|jgi:cytochrome c biogenesis protein CcmG/thiol:disulfide interchange protein DsbE